MSVKKYVATKRREQRRKRAIRRAVVRTTLVVVAITSVATVGKGMIDSVMWSKKHPEAYKYIIENDMEWVTPKQRQELEIRFSK